MFSMKPSLSLDPPATARLRNDADVSANFCRIAARYDAGLPMRNRGATQRFVIRLLRLLLLVLGLTGLHLTPLRASEKPGLSVAALHTEYAFTAHVSVGTPLIVGQGPQGLRRYVPITGGTVDGPLLHGKVLAAGGDSQVVRTDGVLAVDAQYVIQTDDGVTVMVFNRGLRLGPTEVMAKLARGEKVAPSEYYFRTAAQFEAPLGSRYEWLNQAIFVATAERNRDEAVVHFYRVQ
jgi:hypothetical protein